MDTHDIVFVALLLLLLLLLLLFFDPGTQFPGKKNYAMQRQNTKTSWNGLYSS